MEDAGARRSGKSERAPRSLSWPDPPGVLVVVASVVGVGSLVVVAVSRIVVVANADRVVVFAEAVVVAPDAAASDWPCAPRTKSPTRPEVLGSFIPWSLCWRAPAGRVGLLNRAL